MTISYKATLNKSDYAVFLLAVLPLITASLYARLWWILAVSMIIFILIIFTKKIKLVMLQGHISMVLQTCTITYRKIDVDFDSIEITDDTIAFIANGKTVLTADKGIAPEETYIYSLTLDYEKRRFEIGNAKNAIKIFDDIRTFYK